MAEPTSDENQYFLNPEDAAEMARLIALDRFTTRAMGGPLAEQADASAFHRVLDLACGPGGWVLDLAYLYPKMDVMGIDVSKTMIDYASARARTQGLNNASFGNMNIVYPLDFADGSFNLVNGRFMIGFLTREDWPRLIQECKRVLRPGGVLRLTETDHYGLTNSPAFEQFSAITARALLLPGNKSFSPDGRSYGITPVLTGFLRDAGLHNVSCKAHVIDFSAGTDACIDLCTNAEVVLQLLRAPLVMVGLISADDFDELFQQMQIEMRSDDFRAIQYFVTAWGEKE